MKFVHLRYHFGEEISDQNQEGICNLGGATIGFEHDPDNKVVRYTFTLCKLAPFDYLNVGKMGGPSARKKPLNGGKLEDNFQRSIGREHVEDLLRTGHYWEYKYVGDFDSDTAITRMKRRVYEHAEMVWQRNYPGDRTKIESILY